MKSIFTLLSVFVCVGLSAQERTVGQTKPTTTTTTTTDPRTAGTVVQTQSTEVTNSRNGASSAQVSSSPLPYDVNDKYMGRINEFLNSMTVKEMPADFPLYDKSWGVKEYNAVVEAYYTTHLEILKPRVKEKMLMLHPHLQK